MTVQRTRRGIDVSDNQKVIDWGKVKAAGVAFAVLRSVRGSGKTDYQFHNNLAGVRAQGIPFDVYKYSYGTTPEKQKTEAEKYGLIEDLPFPAVSAHADRKKVQDLAEHYAAMILEKQPECVMCQGEFCLSYHVIERLKKAGVRVVAACSERVVEELYGKTGTEKKSVFQFIQFREY